MQKPFDVSTLLNSELLDEDQTYAPTRPRLSAERLPRGDVDRIDSRGPLPGPDDHQPIGPPPIEAILAERSKTHGDFTDNARIMQALKAVVHQSNNWETLTDVQREALHMILHKIGRICSGNPNVHDHWDDIAGYAKLASERIQ
jgi:hypothetical protein